MTQPLEPLLREGARMQASRHKFAAIIWYVLGGLFAVLAIFVRGKSDEQVIRLGMGIAGVASIAGAFYFVKTMNARTEKLVELLLTKRSELREPELIQTRASGAVLGYSVAVTHEGRRYRMLVPTEAAARTILEGIGR